jgi:hypothetical protein
VLLSKLNMHCHCVKLIVINSFKNIKYYICDVDQRTEPHLALEDGGGVVVTTASSVGSSGNTIGESSWGRFYESASDVIYGQNSHHHHKLVNKYGFYGSSVTPHLTFFYNFCIKFCPKLKNFSLFKKLCGPNRDQ